MSNDKRESARSYTRANSKDELQDDSIYESCRPNFVTSRADKLMKVYGDSLTQQSSMTKRQRTKEDITNEKANSIKGRTMISKFSVRKRINVTADGRNITRGLNSSDRVSLNSTLKINRPQDIIANLGKKNDGMLNMNF